MKQNPFSSRFLDLATRLGIDSWKEYEDKYLEYARRRLWKKRIHKRYLTGRGRGPEDVRDVLLFYNDLKTKPSQETIQKARAFFLKAVEGHTDEEAKVKQLARYINAHGRYKLDKYRFGQAEYWSSPFDLFDQWMSLGYFEDDCDGHAVLLWWACVLVGVPKDRLAVWAGIAVHNNVREGHANVVYNSDEYGAFHVEGTFYPSVNQANWGSYKFPGHRRYPETWFYFNDSEVANV